eukprot:1154104-Pelagomonas_calceolata.AAC.1
MQGQCQLWNPHQAAQCHQKNAKQKCEQQQAFDAVPGGYSERRFYCLLRDSNIGQAGPQALSHPHYRKENPIPEA